MQIRIVKMSELGTGSWLSPLKKERKEKRMNKHAMVEAHIQRHLSAGEFNEARAVLALAVDIGIANRTRSAKRYLTIDRAEEEAYALGAEPPKEE